MQKSLLVSIILLFQVSLCSAQNLVYNPGFEITGTIPCGWVNLGFEFDNAATGWSDPTLSTPDLHSTLIAPTCNNYSPHSTYAGTNGWQAPHGGNNFAGIYTYESDFANYREFIEGQLTAVMVPGKSYIVSMYVSLADNSQIATNGPGICFLTSFASTLITYGPPVGYNPQINHTKVITDTAQWVLLTDTIVATAAWQYFMIGNFYNDATVDTLNYNPTGYWNRAYYFIDDISIVELPGVIPPPVAGFQTSDSVICANECISFTNSSVNATSWLWTFPGAMPSSSTDENPQSICYLTSGNYDVKLVAFGSGGADSLTFSNYIAVKPAPATPIITPSHDTLYCSTDPSYISYQWYFNSNLIPGATTPNYFATQSGNYNVAISDVNGCVTSVGINIVIAGMEAFQSTDLISVYPNPATDQIHLLLPRLHEGERIRFSVFNVLGEILMQDKITWSSNAPVHIIKLSQGIYFIKLENESSQWTGKFVKQ